MSGSNHFGLSPAAGEIQDTLSGFGLTGTAEVRAGHGCHCARTEQIAPTLHGLKSPDRLTVPRAGDQRPPDLVNRQFTASRPDQLHVADFAYVPPAAAGSAIPPW